MGGVSEHVVKNQKYNGTNVPAGGGRRHFLTSYPFPQKYQTILSIFDPKLPVLYTIPLYLACITPHNVVKYNVPDNVKTSLINYLERMAPYLHITSN